MLELDESLRILALIVEKADKLHGLGFTRHLLNGGHIGFSGNAEPDGFALKRDGPTEEEIDAFVLTLRFFVQNNEPTSIENIVKLFRDLPLAQERIDAAVRSRQTLNERLDQPGSIQLGDEQLTRRQIFEVFLYGGLAHANPTKKVIYDGWATDPIRFMLLQVEFTSILVDLLNAISWFGRASRAASRILSAREGLAPSEE